MRSGQKGEIMSEEIKTRWVGREGKLICLNSGDEARATVTRDERNFPMELSTVALLMNDAFKRGMEAKAEQIRYVIGV